MFLLSEIHPFLDGNGRLARVMMNAELVRENQSKIIIPTVFREDYMGALKKLTNSLADSAKSAENYTRRMKEYERFLSELVKKGLISFLKTDNFAFLFRISQRLIYIVSLSRF